MHQQVGICGRAGRERKGSETDDSGERTFQGQRPLTGKVPGAAPPMWRAGGMKTTRTELRSDIHQRQSRRRSPEQEQSRDWEDRPASGPGNVQPKEERRACPQQPRRLAVV